MTRKNRFIGDVSDLKITPAPGPQPPVEPWFETSNLNLTELRRRAGLTQQQVADKMGLRRAHVAQMEHSESARLSKLVSYLDAVGGRLVIELDGEYEPLQRVA